MVEIEPYQYQKTTNVKEHNDIVAKINEIIDVINNANIENIGPKIDAIEATDTLQWKDIESIKAKDTEQDATLGTHTTEIEGITKSLVSNVVLMNGTTVGNMKVRIERENEPFIDSNDYNIQKPTSVELIQGSAPAMVKAQITLSDGTVLISDDFMLTTEAIGQDVYISSFVFKNGNVAGTISADIGLSNGTRLEANNFVVPTDPNVLSSIADLTSRTEALEQIDIGGLKTTVDQHTASIEALDNDVADIMLNKADVSNTEQVISAKRITVDDIRFNNEAQGFYAIRGGGLEDNPFMVTHLKTISGSQIEAPIANLAIVESDGTGINFKSGKKKLYTDNLSTLITTASSSATVLEDFDIEYISIFPKGTFVQRVTVSKGTYNGNPIYLGCAIGYGVRNNEPCQIKILNESLNVYVVEDGNLYTATQLTTADYPETGSNSHSYKIYV